MEGSVQCVNFVFVPFGTCFLGHQGLETLEPCTSWSGAAIDGAWSPMAEPWEGKRWTEAEKQQVLAAKCLTLILGKLWEQREPGPSHDSMEELWRKQIGRDVRDLLGRVLWSLWKNDVEQHVLVGQGPLAGKVERHLLSRDWSPSTKKHVKAQVMSSTKKALVTLVVQSGRKDHLPIDLLVRLQEALPRHLQQHLKRFERHMEQALKLGAWELEEVLEHGSQHKIHEVCDQIGRMLISLRTEVLTGDLKLTGHFCRTRAKMSKDVAARVFNHLRIVAWELGPFRQALREDAAKLLFPESWLTALEEGDYDQLFLPPASSKASRKIDSTKPAVDSGESQESLENVATKAPARDSWADLSGF